MGVSFTIPRGKVQVMMKGDFRVFIFNMLQDKNALKMP